MVPPVLNVRVTTIATGGEGEVLWTPVGSGALQRCTPGLDVSNSAADPHGSAPGGGYGGI
jgi:hypothetical protein